MRQKPPHRLIPELLLFVLIDTATAAPPLALHHLTSDDGLPQNTVNASLQDQQGFMWFATEDGVARYDGYEIKRYGRERGTEAGLSASFVWDVQQDRHGDLWLALKDGGVVRWDRRTERMSAMRHDPADPHTLSSDSVRKLLIDRRGRVWIGTVGGGLNVLDPVSGRVEHYRNDPAREDSLSSDVVTSLHEDGNGDIWAGTDDGLNRWLPQSRTFRRYQHRSAAAGQLSSNRISTIVGDRSGALWIGTFDAGLNRLDKDGSGFITYRHNDAESQSLSSNEIRAVLEDADGRLWVGTSAGLDLLDRATGHVERHHADPAEPGSLRDNFVLSLHQDRKGLLWIGTRAGGVSRWNPRSWLLGHQRPAWLQGRYAIAFANDSAGRIWVGTLGAGLTRFDPRSGEHLSFEDISRGRVPLPDRDVMSLLTDRAGNLWIGTRRGGLSRLAANGQVSTLRAHPTDPRQISSDGIMALHEDRSGRIWIGTFGGGVNILDPTTGLVQRIPYDPRSINSLSSPRAGAIAEDPSGHFWIGTDAGGLDLLSPQGKVLHVFRHDPKQNDSLSANTVYTLHVDAKGRVWVGTDSGGLDQVIGSAAAPQSVRFRNVSKANGLTSDTIYGIRSDDSGALWLSSTAGLMRYDPENGRVMSLHRDQGLQDEDFNSGSHFRANDGRMLFGGAKGFNYFDPRQFEIGSDPPRVVLTGVEILNRPAATPVPYPLLKTLELGYQDQMVTFQIAALDFATPHKIRYSYRLRGFIDDWVDIGTQHRISYTNLDAGRYVLEVRAAGADGIWSREPLTLEVTMRPAPWRSVWAYLLYSIAAVLLVLSAFFAQRRKLRHAAETRGRLEREVADRTAELRARNEELDRVSRAKGDFLARMSHEIRTPMNGVVGMSELLLRTELSARQAQLASTICSSAGGLLHIINEILDLSKAEAGKVQLEHAPFDLREVLEESAALLAVQAEAKGLELVVSPPTDETCRVVGDALRIRQVLLNLVGNAIKFTPAGEVTVMASLRRESDSHVLVHIAVKDTGVGMSSETIAHVFEPFTQADETTTRRFGGTGLGLAICKEMVQLMEGTIHVESEPDIGSTFHVSLPLPIAPPLPGARHEALRGLRAGVLSRSGALRAATLRQCRAWGIEIDEGNSLAGLRRFDRAAGAPHVDLLIVDANSLGDELATLAASRPKAAHPPLVLLATDTTAISERFGERFGAAAVVGKPLRREALYRALLTASGRRDRASAGASAVSSPAPGRDAADVVRGDVARLQGQVLVVDDNPVNCMVAEGLLAELGCTVTTVMSGREAVAQARDQRFDVILLDLYMPGLDGFAVTGLIRKSEAEGRRTPIVALTANAAESHRQPCLDAGMDDFLGKPFTLAELSGVLQRWLPAAPPLAQPAPSVVAGEPPAEALRELDTSAIARIQALDRTGRSNLFPRIVSVFVSSSEQQLAQIHGALSRRDLAAVREIAHSLKSSCGNVGASQLARLAGELEQACRDGDMRRAIWLERDIERAHPLAVAALQQEVRRESA